MGKNNRQRRAAKQRKRDNHRDRVMDGRSSARAGHSGGWRIPTDASVAPPPPPDPLTLLQSAASAHHEADHQRCRLLVRELADVPKPQVAAAVQQELGRLLSQCWSRGWQPSILDRAAERALDSAALELLQAVVTIDAAAYERLGREVAPDWMRQVDSVCSPRWWTTDASWLAESARTWTEVLFSAVDVAVLLRTRRSMPVLTPPPSQWHAGMVAVASNVPSALLDKVRALLAKAESTTFDDEAQAFTAKAQELMTRHRIDRAVLQAERETDGGVGGDGPDGRHVLIENPYPEAKATLLAVVASANGGQAVFSKDDGFSTVFARTDELDIIEDLFTSLLVQATAALGRHGSKSDHTGRSRTTRFRRSFLVAFAHRIGSRLQAASDAVVAEAESETGTSLVPLFADRSAEAKDAATKAFGTLGHFRPNATDDEGWFAGELFGDRADLGVGAPLDDGVEGAA